MKRRSRGRRFLKRFVILGFILLTFFIIFWIIFSGFFLIRDVELKAAGISCASSDELIETAKLTGQNILFFNDADVEKRIKDKYLCIKKISLSRSFFKKVTVEVFARKPVAYLSALPDEASSSAEYLGNLEASSSATPTFTVDDEGVIYSSQTENQSTPRLYLVGESLFLGRKIGAGVIKGALGILEKLKSFGLDVKVAGIVDERNLFIEGSPKIIFSLEKNIDGQLASLQLILTQLKINGEKMESVDLRFERPVIKYGTR